MGSDFTNELWTIISIVIGFIISLVFHLIGNKTKKMIYTINSQQLITNKLSEIEGLNITYKDKTIDSLVSTTIKIKSIGNEIIDMNDFAQIDSLRISTTGILLFTDDIQSVLTDNSNLSNKISLTISDDSKTIFINYDYFCKNSTITLNLLHTGEVSVHGTLKKGKLSFSNSIHRKNLSDIFNVIGITLGITFIILYTLVVQGYTFLVSRALIFLFNLLLGLILIDYYNKSSK